MDRGHRLFDTVSDLCQFTHAPPSDALTPNGGDRHRDPVLLVTLQAHPRLIIATTVHARHLAWAAKPPPDNRDHAWAAKPSRLRQHPARTWLSISASRPPYLPPPPPITTVPAQTTKICAQLTSKHQHDENSPPLRNRRADLIKMGPVMPLRWSPPPWRRTA